MSKSRVPKLGGHGPVGTMDPMGGHYVVPEGPSQTCMIILRVKHKAWGLSYKAHILGGLSMGPQLQGAHSGGLEHGASATRRTFWAA